MEQKELEGLLGFAAETLGGGHADWDSISDKALVDRLGAVAGLSRLVATLQVMAAGAVAARGPGPDAAGGIARSKEQAFASTVSFSTPKALLMQVFGLRAPAAQTLLTLAEVSRTGTTLDGDTEPPRPALAVALSRGELTLDQAGVIHDELPEAGAEGSVPALLRHGEASLVALATGGRVNLLDPDAEGSDEVAVAIDRDHWGGRRLEVHHLREQARDWRTAMAPERVEPDYAAQLQARGLKLTPARRGGFMITGFAPETEGAAIQTLLDAYTSPRRPRGDSDGRTREQICFDVLFQLADAHARRPDAPSNHGAAPTLLVTTTLEALNAHLVASKEPARAAEALLPEAANDLTSLTPDPEAAFALLDRRFARVTRSNRVIPVAEALTLLCNDHVQFLITDEDGVPLRLGRKRRHFSQHQRKALIARDRRCRAPGCAAPPDWCEAHHVRPWAEGGDTDVDHGLLLCNFHHHEVHRGRLIVEPRPAVPGTGKRVPSTPWRVISPHTAALAEHDRGGLAA